MRIVVIGPTYPYKGGGAQHTTELAHRLVAAGHRAVVESWAVQYPSFLYPGQQTIEDEEGVPFPAVERDLHWARPWSWWRVGRRAAAADVVVLAVLSPVQVPAYLGILTGLRSATRGRRRPRVVALCHNVLPHEPKPYDAPLMKALFRRADVVLTHSAHQGAVASRLTSASIVTAALPPFLPPRQHAAPRTSADVVHNRVLFFGLVRPYKGLDVMLRALALGPPQVTLTVAGEFWSGERETSDLIAELGLGDRVDIRAGYVPEAEAPALFARSDALVLPYRSATASQNVWLGHEHGVPVIATRVGNFANDIDDGTDGLLVEPNSPESLAEALHRFYAPGVPGRMRAAVRPVDPAPYWDRYIAALLQP